MLTRFDTHEMNRISKHLSLQVEISSRGAIKQHYRSILCMSTGRQNFHFLGTRGSFYCTHYIVFCKFGFDHHLVIVHFDIRFGQVLIVWLGCTSITFVVCFLKVH